MFWMGLGRACLCRRQSLPSLKELKWKKNLVNVRISEISVHGLKFTQYKRNHDLFYASVIASTEASNVKVVEPYVSCWDKTYQNDRM